MPIVLRNVRLELDEPEEQLLQYAAKRLRVPPESIRAWSIVRRSLDARRRDDIHFRYHLELAINEPPRAERKRISHLRANEAAWLEPVPQRLPRVGKQPLPHRPTIIGFGPAGMFAALRLADYDYKPIVLERGRDVRRRHRDVMQRFYRERDFDPNSNLLFGEGGAGTYSDGKLYTRVNNPLVRTVLEMFYQNGADPDILVDARPHIGSDRLPRVCWRIRDRIIALGGEVRFDKCVEDIRTDDGGLSALCIQGGWMDVGPTVVAIGHSARDTVTMLARRGARFDPKPFQIGVRIEHPQVMVDDWQYGACAGHRRLGPAEYHMVAKGAAGESGDLFSFCMCPGGEILPTNESPGLIATNGASRADRPGRFANSGLVITVDPKSLGVDALGAIEYQRRWEEKAFKATGASYRVPAQRATDFLACRSSDGALETSYPLGGQWTSIRDVIPRSVAVALERGLVMLGARFPGFDGGEAIITAPETRASAPFRLVRDPDARTAVGIDNLYPVGEGAGYAGGIISAAVDGIRTADAIIERYAPPSAQT